MPNNNFPFINKQMRRDYPITTDAIEEWIKMHKIEQKSVELKNKECEFVILLKVKVDVNNRMHEVNFDWVEESLRDALTTLTHHHGEASTTDLIITEFNRVGILPNLEES